MMLRLSDPRVPQEHLPKRLVRTPFELLILRSSLHSVM